jgi:dimethylglycine dehydrogenase
MDEYMLYSSVAETAGVYHEFLTPKQIKDRWPLVRTEDLKGALFHPQDGYINPADVTQAMAKGARQLACTIERKPRSTATLDRQRMDRLLHQDGRKGRQPCRLG